MPEPRGLRIPQLDRVERLRADHLATLQLLSLVEPERALRLARLLTAVGAPAWQVARGARTIAALGTEQDLHAPALHFVSLDVELRATTLRAAALRSSPAINPVVLPVLTDADERIARAAYEGFAQAPRPEEGTPARLASFFRTTTRRKANGPYQLRSP